MHKGVTSILHIWVWSGMDKTRPSRQRDGLLTTLARGPSITGLSLVLGHGVDDISGYIEGYVNISMVLRYYRIGLCNCAYCSGTLRHITKAQKITHNISIN